MHGKVLLVISRSCQDHFWSDLSLFQSARQSVGYVGFSVSDLLVYREAADEASQRIIIVTILGIAAYDVSSNTPIALTCSN